MMLTQVQSLALGTFCALIFIVLGGSLIEWAKWIALLLSGVKPARTVKSPQATVGLFDILVTVLVLAMFFLMASLLWRSLGLPAAGRMQQVQVQAQAQQAQAFAESSSLSKTEPTTSEQNGSVTDTEQKPQEARGDQATESPADSNASDDESKIEGESVASNQAPPKPVGISQIQFLYNGYAMSCQLLCVLFMTFFILGRTNCSLQKLGWRTDQWSSDLRAGFQCFLMLTPIILVLNAVLQNVTKTPYEHPVQVMIKEYPWLLGVAFWQAAICAPISEEFGFRALLVGWFESIHFARNKFKAFMLGDVTLVDDSPNEPAPEKESQGEVLAPWWPVLLSGTIFGLAHFNYGVSWFPLIILGVVLGRLYQIRQSLIPVIVVHMLFNAMNLALLALSLLVPKLS